LHGAVAEKIHKQEECTVQAQRERGRCIALVCLEELGIISKDIAVYGNVIHINFSNVETGRRVLTEKNIYLHERKTIL
jgi:hypothetical protein